MHDVPLLRRPTTWLVAAVIALVLAVAAVAGAMLLPGSRPAAEPAPTERPVPAAAGTPAPVLPGTAASAPAGGGPAVPADCASAYATDWTGSFAPDYVLNPGWATGEGAPVLLGTDDPGALPTLEQAAALTCAWLPAEPSDGRTGMVTTIAAVDETQRTAALGAFEAGGLECYEELEGTRCVAEWEDAAGPAGESHFFREGVWIATRWSGPAVTGYTHDIIAAVFD
ncbi:MULTISPECIES: hypothetical protein [unclassified Agromyces]|uniref:hypothetical protein n=1 Tax=unclassified Agromyces TaxID=2639701 RepID=UPI00301447CE